MVLALSVVRLVLAMVFLLAGGMKLADRRHGERLLESFSLPSVVAPAVRALPLAELALAAALLVARTARVAAACSAVLLVVFSALLARQRRRVGAARTAPCNCFGGLRSALLDRHPLSRNAILLAAALSVAAAPSQVALRTTAARLGTGWSAVFVVALALGAVALGVLPGRLASRAGGRASLGEQLRTLTGEPTSLGDLLADRPATRLLFLDPGCGPCRSLLPVLAGSTHLADAAVVVATRRSALADPELMEALDGASAIIEDDGRLAARYLVSGTPALVELDRSARAVASTVGPQEVAAALLGLPTRPAAATAAVATAPVSRRRVVGLALGAFVALRPAGGRALGVVGLARRDTAGVTGGVRCPSCGTCSVCSFDQSSGKLSCRPCSQACSGRKLCSSYANELKAFTALGAYLGARHFTQSAEPQTLGMEQAGKLTVLSSLTAFESASHATPRALLVYDLFNGGEHAWAALLDARGHFVEVLAADANGQVVSRAVPPSQAAAGAAAVRQGAQAQLRGLEVPAAVPGYGCGPTCGFALGVAVALATLPATVLTMPEWVAAAFAASLFSSGIGLLGATGPSYAVTLLTPIALGGSLVNAAASGLNKLGRSTFCNYLCKLETKYCCNYGCGCDQDYHACLARCPLDLQHPGASCNEYVRLGPDTHWLQATGIPSKCKV